ncbi:hypothetical protein Y032_0012g1615 [Ancylostoma ceylanicum]|uniref:Uncharacterized protein n=1 Tax=Ancylostoma ceylanicum TaxID=53326 RepID=A0A016VCI9_9BILA|nr:hypothetical protein Y032_0012g1615 [Ancylostoma ceylanicum]
MQQQMIIKLVCAAKSTVPPLDLPTASSAPSFRKDCIPNKLLLKTAFTLKNDIDSFMKCRSGGYTCAHNRGEIIQKGKVFEKY